MVIKVIWKECSLLFRRQRWFVSHDMQNDPPTILAVKIIPSQLAKINLISYFIHNLYVHTI